MAIAKRVVLFVLVNFLVVMTLSFVLQVLGVGPYLQAYGIDYGNLMTFCFIWGMGGAFISLLLSKVMAKWSMRVQVIDPDTRDPKLGQLVSTVYRLARDAGLERMPEVGVYDSPEVNAFATGPTRRNSLVAVSSGLLDRMSQSAVEGVLAHEISHVANGDMVTMTLLQGVINALVMFLARIAAFAISQAFRSRDSESRGGGFSGSYFLVWILEMVFAVFGMVVIAAFSRWREYRADAGGAKLAGKEKMITALQSLRRLVEIQDPTAQSPAFQNMKISGRPSGMLAFFSTHPPLEARIERLEQLARL